MFIPEVPSVVIDSLSNFCLWSLIFLAFILIFGLLLFLCVALVFTVSNQIYIFRFEITQKFLRKEHISLKLLLKHKDKNSIYYVDD